MGYAEITDPAQAPLAQAAGYLVRHLATGRPLPKGAQNVMELWRGHLEASAGGTFAGLEGVLDDQQAFARFARQVIDDLGYGDQLGEDPDAESDDEEDEARRRRRAPRSRERRRRGGERRGADLGGRAVGRARRAAGHAGGARRRRRRRAWPRSSRSTRARRRSAARRRPSPRPTRPTRSSPPASTRRSPPRISPTRSSSSGCAPISTSSSSR